MTFADFRKVLISLSLLTKQSVPPYAVAKDMFDFIDIKNDNFIDLEEWVQTFARYDVKIKHKLIYLLFINFIYQNMPSDNVKSMLSLSNTRYPCIQKSKSIS